MREGVLGLLWLLPTITSDNFLVGPTQELKVEKEGHYYLSIVWPKSKSGYSDFFAKGKKPINYKITVIFRD